MTHRLAMLAVHNRQPVRLASWQMAVALKPGLPPSELTVSPPSSRLAVAEAIS